MVAKIPVYPITPKQNRLATPQMNHPPSHSPQKIHPRFLLNDKRKDINGPRSISTFLSGFQVKSKELKKKISKKKVEKRSEKSNNKWVLAQ